jgi:hypothetical protein
VRNHVGRGRPAPLPVWGFEIDEQHADLGVPEQVTHRIEHAVAVVARKCDGLTVENANEPRIAALLGDSGSTLVIYGRHMSRLSMNALCSLGISVSTTRDSTLSASRRVPKRSCNER